MTEEIKEMVKQESETDKETQNSDAVNQENQQGKGKEMEVRTEEEMKPWEQHSAVISIPRFDYNAPSSLLLHSHSGFLITCPIKREKSATKEAISIFEKYIAHLVSGNNETSESLDATVSAKRRRICKRKEGDLEKTLENKDAAHECGVTEKSSPVPKDSNKCAETTNALSLVKLTRSGLVLFMFPRDSYPKVVDIVSNIFQSLGSRSLKSPQWCHRILPIQTTCSLDEKELKAVVSRLVNQFLNDNQNDVSRPVKFAVGYNRRGIEESEMKDKRADGSDVSIMLDRRKCFEVVAAAVKEAVADSVVDLKCPELAVLLEVLPLSGIPENKVVVAVSVLPQKLVITKPRLCVRALVSDAKSGKRS